MEYREHLPVAALAPYVKCYWELQGEHADPTEDRVFPDGCTELIFHRGGPFAAVGTDGHRSAYLRKESGVEELIAPRVLSRETALTAVPHDALYIGDPALCAGNPEVLLNRVSPRASALIVIQRGGTQRAGGPRFQPPVPLYLRAAAVRRTRGAAG